jgi:hypothetical protein
MKISGLKKTLIRGLTPAVPLTIVACVYSYDPDYQKGNRAGRNNNGLIRGPGSV